MSLLHSLHKGETELERYSAFQRFFSRAQGAPLHPVFTRLWLALTRLLVMSPRHIHEAKIISTILSQILNYSLSMLYNYGVHATALNVYSDSCSTTFRVSTFVALMAMTT